MTATDRDQPSDPELLRLHVNALFTHDQDGDLVAANELEGTPAPRFFVGWTREGLLLRFRYDVDTTSRRQLAMQAEAFAQNEAIDTEPFAGILDQRAPVQRTWQGPVFYCEGTSPCAPEIVRITDINADLLAAYLSAWLPDVQTSEFLFATVVDGHAVAVCSSVRVTSEAHEAGVETAPDFRRRGYAAKSVLAWAAAIRAAGYAPLYSTSWQNAASRAVAANANLRCFGSDFHIT